VTYGLEAESSALVPAGEGVCSFEAPCTETMDTNCIVEKTWEGRPSSCLGKGGHTNHGQSVELALQTNNGKLKTMNASC